MIQIVPIQDQLTTHTIVKLNKAKYSFYVIMILYTAFWLYKIKSWMGLLICIVCLFSSLIILRYMPDLKERIKKKPFSRENIFDETFILIFDLFLDFGFAINVILIISRIYRTNIVRVHFFNALLILAPFWAIWLLYFFCDKNTRNIEYATIYFVMGTTQLLIFYAIFKKNLFGLEPLLFIEILIADFLCALSGSYFKYIVDMSSGEWVQIRYAFVFIMINLAIYVLSSLWLASNMHFKLN